MKHINTKVKLKAKIIFIQDNHQIIQKTVTQFFTAMQNKGLLLILLVGPVQGYDKNSSRYRERRGRPQTVAGNPRSILETLGVLRHENRDLQRPQRECVQAKGRRELLSRVEIGAL